RTKGIAPPAQVPRFEGDSGQNARRRGDGREAWTTGWRAVQNTPAADLLGVDDICSLLAAPDDRRAGAAVARPDTRLERGLAMSPFPLKKLVEALRTRFGGQVEYEKEVVAGMERYSFYLVSPRFKSLSHLKRQDAVWEVID